ncbi:RagB/SusD family nutrient uptake outer membrane protein [Bacteroides ovatus]|uniref:RagB/SusD family nutrient uptake outer membrane protein n=1 Tax=Bacteroides ovatus TaxID=28116 RepID=UPI0031454683
MKKYSLYIWLLAGILASCGDFLEESSQDLMIPKSVKDYKEFFFGEVMKTKGREIPHPYLEYMTDDVKDQCYYGTRPTPLSNDFREAMWAYYTWQANPEVGMSNEFSTDVAWSSYYHKILMTNIILDQLPEMNGTDMERRDLAGEAYFMRALSYFMLANLYGQPYHPATAGQDLCVPVNDEVSLSDRMMKRATNAVVYAKMEGDVKRSIQCFKAVGGEKSIFRPNLPAAYLLASRIALFQEKYDQTILYSDSVLRATPHSLYKLREDDTHYFFSLVNKEILLSYGVTTFESHMGEDYRYAGQIVVSDDLLAQYPADDLRLAKYFKNTVGRQTSPSTKEYSIYTPFKWKNNSATVYSNAFRISEAYLNRAEAYAVSGETNKALADLNELRENRMKAGAAPLVIVPEGIVATVRKERRRELAFEGFRWFDLRRYGCPPLQHTYSSKATEGAGDIFKLQDKRAYVLPIPKSERDRNTEIETFERPDSEPVK